MQRPCRAARRGLTLVELLVVIAVIGTLAALLLPAVQMAREAARRAECVSKLRQIALASHTFHDVHGSFAPGQCGGPYGFGIDSRCWSWLSRILPHIEQQNVYQTGGIPNSTFRNSPAPPQQLAVFLCPSDGFSRRGPRTDAGNFADERFPLGQTNFKGVSGANWGADETLGLAFIDTTWRNPGTNGSYDGLSRGDGILWRCDIFAPIRMSDVRDGLSNTFLAGEDLPKQNRWCSWPYGSHAYGTCAIPPNFRWKDPNQWEQTHSFRSAHPGGLNFALADGSTRFVPEAVALDVYRAMATRAGGETASDLR